MSTVNVNMAGIEDGSEIDLRALISKVFGESKSEANRLLRQGAVKLWNPNTQTWLVLTDPIVVYRKP